VTHEPTIAGNLERVVALREGSIVAGREASHVR
jgi:hypothetical protein